MKTSCCMTLLMILVVFYSTGSATTWYVKPDGTGDAPTIQAAIDSAVSGSTVPGDTVLLADGTYTGEGNWQINYNGKIIVVHSESGEPELCVIDCHGLTWGFRFVSGEGPGAVLEGVTVTNGSTGSASAVQISASSPTLRNCIFSNNYSSPPPGVAGGGAMFIKGNILIVTNIEDCKFIGNSSFGSGGAAVISEASVSFDGCEFYNNWSNAGNGGAIYTNISSWASFYHCTFAENSASPGGLGGAIGVSSSNILLDNTIIAFSAEGEAVYCMGTYSVGVNCCDIYGNAGGDWVGCLSGLAGSNGNFETDPQFCGVAGSGNFYLQADSPCAPGNHPDGYGCGLIGAYAVNCGSVPVEQKSWGQIKALYHP